MDTSGTQKSNGLVSGQGKGRETEIPDNIRSSTVLVTIPVPYFGFSATWNFFHLLMVYLEAEKVGEGALGVMAKPEPFPKAVPFQTTKKVEEWPTSPMGRP